VTKTWWRVLQLLRERAGRFVPFDFLASASERLPGDGGSTESLKIHIMQLRRALTGSPFAIATKRGAGYGLFPASDVESIQFRRDRDQYRRLSTRLRATWAPGYRPRVSPNMILPGGPHGSWRSDDPR
jgi:DNA-binding winged helix-turn-helix (wHTH) protein